MATGINEDKLNAFKLELLDYTESINRIRERLDNCKTMISSNLVGPCQQEITTKLNLIMNQMPIVNNNINNYISTIGKVINSYNEQDIELQSQISSNATIVEKMKEE